MIDKAFSLLFSSSLKQAIKEPVKCMEKKPKAPTHV
jgi:hypothetical protein